MDLTRLRHLVAVADNGSFSRAAEEQHITQPALSRSVAAFEARYGVRLFDRGRNGVVATPAGVFAIEQARGLLRAADEFERNLLRHGQGLAGSVSFGLGPLMESLILPRLSQELLRSKPNLQIVAVVKQAEELLAELFNGTIEMIIGNRWLVRDAPGVVSEAVGVTDLGVVVRGGHPLVGRPHLSVRDLEAYPMARPIRLSAGTEALAGAFICDNLHVLRDTVLATDCILISSTAFVRDELRDGRMAKLTVNDLALTESEICIITRAGRTRSPGAAAVVKLVRRMLSELRMPPD